MSFRSFKINILSNQRAKKTNNADSDQRLDTETLSKLLSPYLWLYRFAKCVVLNSKLYVKIYFVSCTVGTDVNAVDKTGLTPLAWAAAHRQVTSTKIFLLLNKCLLFLLLLLFCLFFSIQWEALCKTFWLYNTS